MDDDELRQKFAMWRDSLERLPVPAVGLVSRRLARRRARNVTLAGVAAVAVLAGSGLAARALVGGPDRTPAGPSVAGVRSTDTTTYPPPIYAPPTYNPSTTVQPPQRTTPKPTDNPSTETTQPPTVAPSSSDPSSSVSTSAPSTTPSQNSPSTNPSTSPPACSTARAAAGGGSISACPGVAAIGATVTVSSDGLCGAASLNNLTLVFLGPKASVGSGGGGVEIPVTTNGSGFHATFRIPASYPGGGARNAPVPVTPGTTYSFDTYPAGGCHVPFTVTGN